MVGIIIDLMLIAIIALCAFIGYKQGFIKAVINMTAFLIALIVALILYKPIANLIINNTELDNNIETTVIEKITPEGLNKEDKVTSEINISSKIVDVTNNSIENIAHELTVKLIYTVTFLLIFILAEIILKFVTAIGELINKIPLLKEINKTGGLIFGLIRGIIIAFVILGILMFCEPIIGANVTEYINKTIITKTIYNNNIIIKIIL